MSLSKENGNGSRAVCQSNEKNINTVASVGELNIIQIAGNSDAADISENELVKSYIISYLKRLILVTERDFSTLKLEKANYLVFAQIIKDAERICLEFPRSRDSFYYRFEHIKSTLKENKCNAETFRKQVLHSVASMDLDINRLKKVFKRNKEILYYTNEVDKGIHKILNIFKVCNHLYLAILNHNSAASVEEMIKIFHPNLEL